MIEYFTYFINLLLLYKFASDTLSSAAPPQRRGNSVARDMLSECEARYCGCRRKLLEVVVPLRLEAARRQCLGGSGKLTSSLRASGGRWVLFSRLCSPYSSYAK